MLKYLLIPLFLLNITRVCPQQQVQWADKVFKFSSQWKKVQYSARQILGPPNTMPQGGSNPCAWQPRNHSGLAFIHVGFKKPANFRQVAIAENYNPGTIIRVTAVDQNGKKHKLGPEKPDTSLRKNRWFRIIRAAKTPYKISSLLIYLNCSKRRGAPQIDAVGISSSSQAVRTEVNTAGNAKLFGEPQNLGKKVNSIYDEVTPIISPGGEKLYFVRKKHPENKGGINGGDDIWYVNIRKNGSYSKANNPGSPLNNKGNNSITSILPGLNTLLVRNSYGQSTSTRKSVALISKGQFGWKKTIPQQIKNYFNLNPQSSFFLANDGKTLLMAIERYDTYGGLDLYVSFLTRENQWSQPGNLGPDINTAADEITPFLAGDQKTLYFSTKGYSGYGNADIFISKRLNSGWKNWTKPRNLGPAINTPGWDAFFSVPASAEWGYYVSYHNTLGMADIFRIKLPAPLKPSPVILVKGQVLNAKTNQPMSAKIVNEDLQLDSTTDIGNSEPNKGKYALVLRKGQKHGFFAASGNHIAMAQQIDATEVKEFEEKIRNIYLYPIEVGQTIRMNNIFFEFGKAKLKNTSVPELMRVYSFLKENPAVEIEIAGHTDSVDTDQYNLELSQKRARAVANFLLKKGIKKTRIRARGYGENKPVAPNNTPEGRQKNRRVEFTILKK